VLTNEIPILEVEAIQLIACLLRIHDIFINDEAGALGVVRRALPYLSKSC
jgi:hypothetical protein